MANQLAGVTKHSGAPLGTIVFLILTLDAPAIFAAHQAFQAAREMLHSLHAEQHEAATGLTRSKLTRADIDKRLVDVQQLVNVGIASRLNSAAASACGMLQEEIRRSLGYGGEPDPNVASVLCVERNNEKYAVAAYDLTAGPTHSRSWIGVFGRPAPRIPYQVLAAAENTLPNHTVALAPLPPGPHGQLRFLAYGVIWGDPHKHLTVLAYALEGNHFKQLWTRSQLPEGEVKAHDDRIDLSFLNVAVGPGFRGVHWVKQAYRVMPAGVRLESTVTGPNSTGVKPPAGTKRVGPPNQRGVSRRE